MLFRSGTTPRAPYWIQDLCLEWFYRLIQEPLRLQKRYVSTIPHFIYLATRQLLIPRQQRLNEKPYTLSGGSTLADVENLNFSSEKLGEILIRQNILTREDLRKALREQSLNPNLKLGEILVSTNLISLSQLKFYLKNQNIKLGRLLVEKKLLEEKTLHEILQLQSHTNDKLGKILVKQKNIISQDTLKEILFEQYLRRKGLFLSENMSDYISQKS